MVGVPQSPAVENMFPAARQLEVAGVPHLLVPHEPSSTFILRKLGFDVPAPILTHYDWCGGEPFEVQRQTCALLTMNPRAYVLNGMGTGKTKAALWAWDYLRGNNIAKRMLVLAPLSTLTFTWSKEAFQTLPHRKVVVLHGDKKRRLQRLNDPEADILVINHDGIKVIEKEIMAAIDAGHIDSLCIDELAAFRSHKADRTKIMRRIAAKMTWAWGMTGSPIPNSPTDAWAQASIITPTTVPTSFTRFRDQLMTRSEFSQFKFFPKPDAVDRAFAAMQPAVRFTLDDVMELPECIERTQDVDLGPQQAKIYKALMTQCHAAVATNEITAANAGAVMMKLLQVSCGWVYAKGGKTVELDGTERIKALVDAVLATDRKVLVFVPFKHALAGISKAMNDEGIEHAVVSGDTPVPQRAQIFNAFQNTDKYHAIAAHPQCLAHGITLTAADTVIWYGPVTSLEIYDQANHRIRRVGQKHKQLVLHLQSTPVEKKIYTLLRNKQTVQNMLLGMFEDSTMSNLER
jgi:SNF2 family DNA or RNA helicase